MTQEQINTLKGLAANERQKAIAYREISEAWSRISPEAAKYREHASLANERAEALEVAIARLA